MDYVKNIDLSCSLSLLLVVCTQSVEEFTAPVVGDYKLQCWGAEGGRQSSVNYKNCFPGKGGYSEGILKSFKPATIYISVGQHSNKYSIAFNNSPNGLTSFAIGYSGGGATNITTTNRGELKNFDSYRKEVLIVAGGGGGCEWNGQGGAGGDFVGKDGNPITNESRKG